MVAQVAFVKKIVLNFVGSVAPVGIYQAECEFYSEQDHLENVGGKDKQEHTPVFLQYRLSKGISRHTQFFFTEAETEE